MKGKMKRTFTRIIFFVMLLAFGTSALFSASDMPPPASDHFDGKKFFNPTLGNIEPEELGDLVKMLSTNEKSGRRQFQTLSSLV